MLYRVGFEKQRIELTFPQHERQLWELAMFHILSPYLLTEENNFCSTECTFHYIKKLRPILVELWSVFQPEIKKIWT
jgi:hypothetical protein